MDIYSGGGVIKQPLAFEPLDGFSNFKKVNDSIFFQQFSKMIRFADIIIVQDLGRYIFRGGVVMHPQSLGYWIHYMSLL